MNRETELRAEVARMEAAGRPFYEVRAVVAQLRAEVARRVEKETAAEARRGAITSEALSVSAETLKTPQGPETGQNGQAVKGNHNDPC
ncbi:MAG: hypothetical protein GXY15_07710 [Candidatus Hydrogenedentes bacterium]|nr:hypothetical protein [Candidatus Hydrogenedentota bacterium]